MKILIIGGTGLLGSALIRNKPSFDITATYHENTLLPESDVPFRHLEVRDKNEVSKLFNSLKPNVVIHTAAKSSPDYCELHPKEANEINVKGTLNILNEAKKNNAKTFFMSSNQVFSGITPPYKESDKRDPVNVYGKTKVQSEDDIKDGKYNATVIRLMTMYGWANPNGQKNSAVWAIDMLKSKTPIKVVDDVFNNFLWVGQAAEIIWKLVEENISVDLLQLAGSESLDRYNFTKKVAKEFGLDSSLISPVKKSYFQDEAPRPLNTIYDTSKMEKITKTSPMNVSDGLRQMHKEETITKWKTWCSR